jgi:hypothetical protein
MLPPQSTRPTVRPLNQAGSCSAAASPAAPAPSTTVFSMLMRRLTACSISGSDTSRMSSTSWRTMGSVRCPGAFTAMPSASVSPRMGSRVPLMALYMDG